jgi:phosphomannomutase
MGILSEELSMITYSTDRFTVNSVTKTFVAEASDLGAAGQVLFDQIYSDAADVGLLLRSSKTGSVARFYLETIETTHDTDEGEILNWTLLPTSDAVRQHPALNGWKMIIFND